MLTKTAGSIVLTLGLLGGLLWEKGRWPQPTDVEPYHAEVAAVVPTLPDEIGPWKSHPIELPRAAVALLRPNALLSREYTHAETGKSFTLLLIQCRDARDMVGHYPPVCYPASGWRPRSDHVDQWTAAGQAMQARSYEFAQPLNGASARLYVTNLILLPDGEFGLGMDDIDRVAENRQNRVFGAAQVQFVFGPMFSTAERRAIVERFTEAAAPVIQTIRSGVES